MLILRPSLVCLFLSNYNLFIYLLFIVIFKNKDVSAGDTHCVGYMCSSGVGFDAAIGWDPTTGLGTYFYFILFYFILFYFIFNSHPIPSHPIPSHPIPPHPIITFFYHVYNLARSIFNFIYKYIIFGFLMFCFKMLK
jgi:hypothetical protein